ncbi:MAG: universal stress protein [Candidatus Dormibacteraeota bacterium]|nr:universal stress protein [Candidatus Dormibacteraeota bacterium]
MFERILAAIDADPERAAKVLDAAQGLAGAGQGQVLVVHVRDLERSAGMIGMARPGAIPPRVNFESEETAQGLVDGAVAKLKSGGAEASGQVSMAGGSTARELLQIADQFRADVIVVGDRGSSALDVLLGSVAHKIVNLAKCQVLLVR